MKSYKAYVAFFDTIEDVLRVYELNVKPWGKHEVTCDRPCPAFGFKSRLPAAHVFPNPEVAVAAWIRQKESHVAQLERSLENAQAALKKGRHGYRLTGSKQ